MTDDTNTEADRTREVVDLDLLPCPFCNGKAQVMRGGRSAYNGHKRFGCTECDFGVMQ